MNKPDPAILKGLLTRQPGSNKYDFGHILVVGGAPGMVGAPYLAARAALRIGAGLATIAARADVIDKLEREVEEIMTLRLPGDNSEAADTLLDFIDKRKVKAVAIGPGLDSSRANMVRQLLRTSRLPGVLDAGGLHTFDNELEGLGAVSPQHGGIILSPHAGEFRRLLGKPLPGAPEALKDLVLDTARTTGTIIILKGDHTLVAAPDGQLYVNPTGNPGLATAGTGDVLTGVLAGLLAQGLRPFEAATAGTYLHGLAGDLAAAAKTEPSLIASDVIEYLPAALQQV